MQNIKIEFAKYRTNGFILDFLVKSLNITQEEKFQRFVREEKIGTQTYHDTLNNLIDDILHCFFDNRSAKEFIYYELLFKEFLSYFNLLKTTNETLSCSQKQLDFIVLINTFIPLIQLLIPTQKSQMLLDIIIPDKHSNAIQKLFQIIEKTFKNDGITIQKVLFAALDKKKDLGYNSINQDIENWLGGKNIPDSRHVDIFIESLSIYSNNFTKSELNVYFKLAKVIQYLYDRSIAYFGDDLTTRLIEHFRFLSALKSLYFKSSMDNQQFEKLLQEIFVNIEQHIINKYIDMYFYNNIHLTAYLKSRVKDNDKYIVNQKQKITKFIRDNNEYENVIYLIDEKDFFEKIDTILPVKYFNGTVKYEQLKNIDNEIIDKKFQTYSERLGALYILVHTGNNKTKDDEQKYKAVIENFEKLYVTEENPYYHFIKARYLAQKREYKKSTEHYLAALKFGKNCMGANIKAVIKEGLIISAQDTRQEKLDLNNAKSPFTVFYQEAYLYQLIDDLPEKINQYFLNDMKKQFDFYFTTLYPDTKKARTDDLLRNMGIVNNIQATIDFNNPNKEIKKSYQNKVTQLINCSFNADYASVRKLMQNGADVNYIRVIDNYTALIASLENKIKKEHIKIAKLLIPKMSQEALNAKLIKNQETALSYAINRGLVDIVKLLIDNGVDINQKITLDEFTPLYYCLHVINIVKNGVANLLDFSDTKFIKENPLESKTEMKKILKTFNMPNSVFNNDKETTFNKMNDDKNFQLIQHSLFSDNDLILELYYTKNLDHLYEIFDLLLETTKNVNVPVKNNFTPLIFATQLNEELYVDKLLKKGADKTLETIYGHTALDYALQNNNKTLYEKLN